MSDTADENTSRMLRANIGLRIMRETKDLFVQIFDYGETVEGKLFYTMEYLRGIDLMQLVSRFGAQPPSRALHLVRQICLGLGDAHRNGLIHRDIKPANIVITPRTEDPDFVKILDFGVVKRLPADTLGVTGTSISELLDHGGAPDEGTLETLEGAVVGTPAFMAPEQLEGKADARSDIYAVGGVLFFLLTGHMPFAADSVFAMLHRKLFSSPPPPSEVNPSLRSTGELDRLTMRCLSPDPELRYPDVLSLAKALDAVSVDRSWTKEDAAAFWREVDIVAKSEDSTPRGAPADTLVD